jgi:PAS domain S-box-containing protein/putative nucleotidyltransferase with HDIG domain
MPEFFYRIRTRLLIIVILAIFPSIVLTIVNSSESRHQAEKNVKEDLQNLSLLLSEEEKHAFNDERMLLVSLAGLPEIRSGDDQACSRQLASFLTANPNNLNLGVIDKNGLIFCSALPINGSIDVSDRSYFQHALEFRDFSIGDYQLGRITGKPAVNFGLPVLDPSGQVDRVVFGALDLGYLSRLLQEAALPPGDTVTVLDRNGTILARFPETEALVGESIGTQPIFSAILNQAGNGSLVSPGLDGIPRLFAFNKLRVSQQDADSFLLIGVPEDIAYADADRLLRRNLIGIALASTLALAATWLIAHLAIVRPVYSLMMATRRLASGKLDERVDQLDGHGELSRLGQAFNEMASALEKRDLEMQHAHDALQESEQRYRTVFEDVPVGLYRTTPGGEILDANPALLEMFAYPDLETLRAVNAKDIYVSPSDRERLATLHEGQEIVRDFETQLYRYDGKLIWVRDTVRSIRDAYGELKFFEGSLQDVTNYKLAVEGLRCSWERLASLHRIDVAIASSLDIQVTLSVILEQLISQLKVDAADFLIYNPVTHVLDFAAGQGFLTDALKHTHLSLGDGYAGIAALERHSIYVPDLADQNLEFYRSTLFQEERFISYHAVPLLAKGTIKGVLEVYLRSRLDPDREWLEFLDSLAGQAAIAVESAALFDGLQRKNIDLGLAYETTLEGWSRALDLRDKETEGHTQRVTQLSLRLAREMKMGDEDLVHTRRGALLHDIGKMGVPDGILHKPGPLTEAEWELMRKHPTYAFELLSPIEFLRPAIDIPYCHHEKWDGSGYPRGLCAEQIPLPARIFAVVDVWDALISDRPYRKAWDKAQALDYIREQAGLHFDPQVVEVFLKIMGN